MTHHILEELSAILNLVADVLHQGRIWVTDAPATATTATTAVVIHRHPTPPHLNIAYPLLLFFLRRDVLQDARECSCKRY